MSDKKVYQISDEHLMKCMKDYLEIPCRYHPEYLEILLKDYERRVNEKLPENNLPRFENPPPCPPRREFLDVNTSANATIKIP